MNDSFTFYKCTDLFEMTQKHQIITIPGAQACLSLDNFWNHNLNKKYTIFFTALRGTCQDPMVIVRWLPSNAHWNQDLPWIREYHVVAQHLADVTRKTSWWVHLDTEAESDVETLGPFLACSQCLITCRLACCRHWGPEPPNLLFVPVWLKQYRASNTHLDSFWPSARN